MNVIKKAERLIEELGSGWPVISSEIIGTIPYFGKILKQVRDVNQEQVEYYNILRHFGWSVVFGVTKENNVLTIIQWKPGANKGTWELPPGGIGKITEEASFDLIFEGTKKSFQKETGYGKGNWRYLNWIRIETGKYRGATPESHGFKAHLWLATDLEKISEFDHAPEEKIKLLPVPLNEFPEIMERNLISEESAVCCIYKALIRLDILKWD